MPCVPGGPQFAFLVQTHATVGNEGDVLASIGANDALGVIQFGKGSSAGNQTTIAGDFVNLLSGASVFDVDVGANHLRKGIGALIRGTQGPVTLPLTAPFCPIPTLACDSSQPKLVPKGGNLILTPGTYGALMVLDQGDLILSGPGTFSFCSIKTGRNANILIKGSGLTTINVVGSFRLADSGKLAPDTGVLTPFMNVMGGSFRIGRRSSFQAFLSAPNARLSFGRSSTFIGTFCALSMGSDKGITMMCPPVSSVLPSGGSSK